MTGDQEALLDFSNEDLLREITRRSALALKKEYERRLAGNAHVSKNIEVFAKLAEIEGREKLANDLREMAKSGSMSYSSDLIVVFDVHEDPGFIDRIMNKNGKYVWEQFA